MDVKVGLPSFEGFAKTKNMVVSQNKGTPI